jgi:phospholipid/cholesterol/gamma-HCH transport system ATP-binding protein
VPKTETRTRPEAQPGAPEAEISIVHVTKRFGKQTIFEDLTFDIPKGKVTLILGPSGTGKSVFLKNVMGLLKPEEGEIWVGGQNVPALPQKELYQVRRKFGVLFQDGALFGSMSVYDNVAFPLREHTRKGEREIKDICMEKLQMVGLIGAEQKLPGQISGGMKKRAGLARALVLDPEIIMFDEPDSGLDPVRTAFLNELILDLNAQMGSTMVVVTHDIATARRVADYIGMLYLRRLVRFDTKDAMFQSDIPVIRQFLAGATDGPIGMSEEADRGKPGEALDESIPSTLGMTAAEVEELERRAGAPQDGSLNGDRQMTTVTKPVPQPAEPVAEQVIEREAAAEQVDAAPDEPTEAPAPVLPAQPKAGTVPALPPLPPPPRVRSRPTEEKAPPRQIWREGEGMVGEDVEEVFLDDMMDEEA